MKIFLILLIVLVSSCSSFKKSKDLKVSSSVKAQIALFNKDQNKWLKIGETPFSISIDQLVEQQGKSDWIYLQVSAPGFASEQILLPMEASSAYDLKVELKEIAWWNDPQKNISSRIVQQVGTAIQKIYRFIRLGKLDESLTLVESLIKEYPETAILYDIRGSIYVLQQANDLAISSYERSLQISSDNPETQKILEQLKRGVRR